MPDGSLPPLSLTIVLTLCVIVAGSVWVFIVEVRRWTTRRQWLSLVDWARQRGMKPAPAGDAALAAPLDRISSCDPRVRLLLQDAQRRTMLVQFQTSGPSGSVPEGASQKPVLWNVLVRRAHGARAAAGLRPVRVSGSAIDLFRLTPFHSLTNERFAVVADSGTAAAELARGSVRALLPPDIGLLQLDEYFVLDFSTRPFDPVELDRMLAVAEQISRIM